MDASYEDKMYHQVERSLANNINDRVYVPIEMIDKPTYTGRKSRYDSKDISKNDNIAGEEALDAEIIENRNEISAKKMDGSEYKEEATRLSRAEYIRLAREACLRQLNAIDTSGKIFENTGSQDDIHNPWLGRKKKDKVTKLFSEGREEEETQYDLASYRSLIIRTVCAIVVFLSIFIIDKIKLSWGNFSYETIKNYITGNNQLKVLEDLIVSWLK